jgi:hypothetical protein
VPSRPPSPAPSGQAAHSAKLFKTAAMADCGRCVPIASSRIDDAERLAEAEGWHEFHSLVDLLAPDELLEPGYYPEGWSGRDVVGHVGAWLAEGGLLLEQMRAGTYVEGEIDVDASNARFFELMRDLPLEIIHLQAWAARWRLLGAWSLLDEVTPAAEAWLAKSTSEHYEEHLPRLREWVAELVERRQ